MPQPTSNRRDGRRHAGLRRPCLVTLLAALVAFVVSAPVRAQNDYWIAGANGAWNVGSNWSLGLPGSSNNVYDNVGYVITFNGGSYTVNSFTGAGSLMLTGGALGVIGDLSVANSFSMNGGQLFGATIISTSAPLTVANNGNNLISGVTDNSGFDLGGGFSYAESSDALNGASTFAGGNLQLYNYYGGAQVGVGGTLSGYGTINQGNSGGNTMTVGSGGTINANSSGNTLAVAIDNLSVAGTVEATSGGTFALTGGTLTGAGGSINTTDTTGTVEDNGGVITGTLTGIGAAGITFVNNGNNLITGATIGGNITVPGFTYMEGTDALNGAGTMTGGNIQLYNYYGGAQVSVGGTLQGYGTINQGNSGGNTMTVGSGGTINANSSGNTLAVAIDNLSVAGTVEASNGGTFALTGGTLTGAGGSINTTDSTGTVEDNGGTITGTLTGTGAAGITFLNNGNNLIYNGTIGGNITVPGFTFMYGADALNGTSTLTGGSIRLHNYYGAANVAVGGTLQGYGLVNEDNGGGNTLSVGSGGSINANVLGQTLSVGVDYLDLTGTIRATNGGTFSLIGGSLVGSNGYIDTTDSSGTVEDNGGTVSGTLTGAGTAGITFIGNGSNLIGNATIGGNITLPSGGFTYAEYTDALNGTSTFAGGDMRLYNNYGPAMATVGGSLVGYGTIDEGNGGGNTLNVTGTVNANVSGQTLGVAVDNLTLSGTIEATAGGAFSLNGGTLIGSNGIINTSDSTGTVQDNGGAITGTLVGTGAAGITFTSNGNNLITGATIGGNITLAGGGFVRARSTDYLNGTSNFTGGNLQLDNYYGAAGVTIGGTAQGYGLINEDNGGGNTVYVTGSISANVASQTLSVGVDYLNVSGTIEATTGGTFSLIGGTLVGSGGIINTTDATGTVEDNGGAVTGTLIGVGTAGITFINNGNNLITGATIGGDVTVPGYVRARSTDALNGTSIMAGGNLQLDNYYGAANVTVGGTMVGYGTVNEDNGGGNTLSVTGAINANSSGNTLAVAVDDLYLTGTIRATSGGIFSLAGGTMTGNNGTIDTSDATGTVEDNGGAITGTFTGIGAAGITFLNNGNNLITGATIGGNITVPGFTYAESMDFLNGTSTFTGGTLQLYNYYGGATVTVGGLLHGYGTINQGNGGNTLVTAVGGTIQADSGAGNSLNIGVDSLVNNGTLQAIAGSALNVSTSYTPTSSGTINAAAGSQVNFNGSVNQTGGQTTADGTIQLNSGSGLLNITAGGVNGAGAVKGSVTNNGGTLQPGDATPGTLTITGNYFQTSTGTMNIRLNGHTPGYNSDVLQVGGNASVAGALDIYLANGPHPFVDDVFDIVYYTGTETGTFNSVFSENPLYEYSINYGTGTDSVISLKVTSSPVPGPDSLVVFGVGMIGGAGALRRRSRNR